MKLLILVVITILAAVQGTTPNSKGNHCGHTCSSHADCTSETACISHKCADPCPGRCGANSICKVVNHVAACACQSGYTGDPFHKCDPQSGAACPYNSWPPVAIGTKKFWVETLRKSDWIEAVMFCMQKGMRLATIMTQQDLDDAKEAIKKTGIRGNQFWLGGTDHLYENEWIWFTTNQPFTEVKDWDRNQPDSQGEDCLEFWERDQQQGYKWNDRTCSERHNFICEYFE